ncbi:MAG: hypothetical protein N2559_17535, partial [Anaerolineae bacterium]|nr:hypothetical protein [Anaerolineae bacterium]
RQLVQGLYRESKPTRLIVEWQPVPPDDSTPADVMSVRRQIHLVFDACALALVNYLMQYPEQWQRMPEWAHTTIAWFIRTFTQGDLKTRLEKWTTEANPSASAILQTIRENTRQVLQPSASPDYIIAELVKAIQPLGLDGIWIVADGLEKWVTIEPERLATDLANFLSALILFERTKLVYKFFVPQHLESALCAATGVQRRRLDSYRLQWDASALQTMVERRLALATGIKGFTLTHLCATPAPKKTRSKKTPEKQLTLLDWLQAAGGTNPREWLDQVRPLVQYYLEHRLNRPIDATTWRELRRNYPPRLYFDDSKKHVIVGGRAVPLEQIPAQAYEMLRYLIKHSNQTVDKPTLYFQGYRGLERVPHEGEKGYEKPIEYEGLIAVSYTHL